MGNYRYVDRRTTMPGNTREIVADEQGNAYSSAMTDTELWQRVGEALTARREEMGFSSCSALSDRHGGRPNWRVMRDLEAGQVKTLKVLRAYCDILKLDLADLFSAALPRSVSSAEVMRLARLLDAAPPKLRGLMLELVETTQAPASTGTASRDAKPEPVKTHGRTRKRS